MKKIYKAGLYGFLSFLLFQVKIYSQPGVGPAPYCMPAYTGTPCNNPGPSNSPGNTVNDFIHSFNTAGGNVNIVNNNSGCNAQVLSGAVRNYFYHGCNNVLRVSPAQTISCNIQSGNTFAQGFVIFIDWNNNSVFNVPGERVAFTTTVPPAGTFTTLTFVVPAGQAPGLYRMRVRGVFNSNGSFLQPCVTYNFGETEDYNIVVGTLTATAGANSPVCAGQTLSLTTSVGGTNQTPTYTWTGPNGFTSNLQNPTIPNVTTAASGVYTVTVSASCTTAISTVSVVVNALPSFTATASPSSICLGNSSTLSAVGALNYTWNPGGMTGSSVVVTPVATTIYTVTGSNGLCSDTRTLSVTVNPNPTVSISASSTSVCTGMATTLTASGANTYTWSTSATGSATVVNPVINTTYSVIGTSTAGCTGTANINITVVPTPTNFVTFVNPPVICIGGTSTLFASALNASSYTWFPGGLVGNTVNVSPTVTTVYTVIAANGGCTNSAQATVTVNPGPSMTVVSSPTAVCPGGSSTLSASGALGYTWSPGGVVSASLAVSPTVTSTYSVTGVNGIGCTSTSTVSVILNPVPNITITPASPSICIGTSGTLTASGASSYTWNPGSLAGSSIVVSPTVNTTYTIIGSNGTCTNSTTKSVTVVPNPTVTASSSTPSICAGQNATLTGNGATTYTWNPGGLTGANVVVSPTITTTYSVTGSTAGCSGTSTVSLIVNNGPTLIAMASPTNICAGSSATLSASGATGYTWNPGSMTSGTVVVNPPITTTYSVTGINGFGCTTTQTVSLNVTSNPTVTASPSSPTICIGSSATLTGGGATSYTWNPGGLTGAIVVVSPTINTTYTVTGTTSGCSNQNTVAITVVNLPTVTAASSPTSICSGSSATLTGGGATSYTWNPGALTGSNVVVSPTITTTYTVTGAITGGCSNTASVTLTVNNGPALTAGSSPTSICSGGTATLSASGAIGYTWNPGAITGGTIAVTPTVTTNYSVTGVNGLGCTTTQTVSLTVIANPTVTASASSSSVCIGGGATLTAGGATTYTWNPGSLTGGNVVVTPTSNTTYTVIGSTGGCSGQNTVAITVVPLPTVTAISSPTAICNGGSATLTANGASTYTWNPGALSGSNVVVSPTITTTYTVTGNNGACSSTSTISLVVNPNPTLTANASPTTVCVTGNVTLTAGGATSYTWNPGSLTGSNVVVTPTVTTTYTVTGTGAFGCSGIASTTVVVSSVPVLTLAATPTVICSGSSSTLTALGASSYTWNPGSLTGSNVVVSPTVTTVYTVNATSGGCSASGTLALVVNPTPTVNGTASPTNICSGSSSTLSGSGANTYTWNPGGATGTTISVNPTVTTIYTVTGSSLLGCSSTNTLSLVVTPNPTVVASASPTAICIGANSSLTANGATSYTWNPGALTGSNIIVSPTITTTYSVTGANGSCVNTQTVSVVVNPNPTLSAGGSPNPVCEGSPVTLTVSGAAGYTWNPGTLTGSNVVVTPTTSTSYTVIGASIAGCTNIAITNITVNPLPTLSVTSSNSNICAGNSATLTGSGGVSYMWNPGGIIGATIAVTPTATTIYTLTGSSGSGCLNTITFTQVVNPNPTVSVIASPTAICFGGSATLTANGATNYSWNPGALTGSNVVVSPTLTTTYTITGANGPCVNTETLNLTVNPTPTLSAGASPNPVCQGSPVTLTVSGATSYTWNPGALTGSNVVVTPTVNTSYTATGANGFGCSGSVAINVTVNPLPSLTVTSSNTNICSGSSATLSAGGGVSYVWNPGGTPGATLMVTPTVTTIYTLTGTSGAGCMNTITFTQAVTPNPTVNAIASQTSVCIGGSSTLTASGALSYTWSPGSLTGSNVVVTPTSSTVYTVTGANGSCINSQTVSVIVNPLPTLSAGASPNPICLGGAATLTVSGGSSYTWNPGALTGSNVVVTPTSNTTYTATGTNTFGCTNTAVVGVTVNPLPTLSVSSTSTNICSGASATLTGSGASTYTWNPGGTGSTLVITPTVTSNYTLTGASLAGCTNTITFTQSVTPTPTITASSSPTSICAGQSSTLTAGGASTYTWNPGALTGSNVVVTPTATVVYTVAGANGICNNTQTVSVMVNPTPTLIASASPSVLCFGGSSTLTASGSLTYTWNPGSMTGSLVVVTPTTNTSYTVASTNSLGCSGTAVVDVTVNPVPTLTITGTSTNVCEGSSATLTAGGADTYTWNPGGSTGSVIVVTPTATTIYTITGQNLTSCSATAQYTVVVNPTPTISALAIDSIICAGVSSTLSATGASSYTWAPGGLTGNSVIVTPTITTGYTVTGSNGTCASSVVVTITVNAVPGITASASPTIICSGETTTLTASGAILYAWLPVSQTGSTVTDTPSLTTTYTVIGSNGTCTSSAMVSVSVNPSPTLAIAASPTAVCFGNSGTLTASGAANYTWQPGGSNSPTVVVTPTTNTTYTLYGSNGTCENSISITLSVNPNPTINVNASSTLVCAGSAVSLTAAGASSYSWNPGSLSGASVVVNPTITTEYTVSAEDLNGCGAMASISVSVNTGPTITATPSSTSICLGESATITASGAETYTWNPGAMTGSVVTINPTVTTTYTIAGSDLTGCSSTQTVELIVLPIPTVTAISSPTAICFGNSATLTASGASSYTWEPGSMAGATIVVTPTVTTTFTVLGSNGICGSSTTTLELVVNDLPANVTASVSGQISCSSPSVDLLGNSTSTSVAYLWTGPGTYTSAVQNPTGITIPGTYTLTVTNLPGGCEVTETVAVTTDTSVPTITTTVTGTITCADLTATLSAITSATNAGFVWSGPGSFSNSAATCTVSDPGSYTLTVTDLDSNCPASTVVTVMSNTIVPITASVIPATCSGTLANNDGMIIASGFGANDKYDFVEGTTYTGTATYTTAANIPIGGVLTNTLNNPFSPLPYTVRFFAENGCFKDTTLVLMPTSCITNTVFGIAKAVSDPTLNTNGTYDVSYFIVVKNTGAEDLNNIMLTENLSLTFPPPTTFSFVTAPLVASQNSSLVLDGTFDGNLQTVMTNTLTSILPAGKTDTIMFTLNVQPNGIFGPFINTVLGFASPTAGVVFSDSSNTGYDPDPDLNGIPTDNSLPTILNLPPNLFFGLTKVGELSEKRDDNTYDVSYTITVHNLGNDTLREVTIKDSLFNNVVRLPASYILKAGPVVSGSLTANTNFNGDSDVNLVIPSQSKLPPGMVSTIEFTINVTPDTITVIKNSAFGSALSSGSVLVSDTSNNGTNPDSNGNGIWNEPEDNVPTVLTIPNSTLFVPNGFSPDGDGKNDMWVIKGLPSENKVTIYNRWGNKVYQKQNYDNTWDGFPNVSGTLGNQKLSQGTYYYIIEFSDGSIKPLNGFVVIQY